jgi:hypothetical protein
MKRSFSQKQIPTVLGIIVLIVSLIGGIAFIGTGGGVFSPRATPQTTPKKVKVTNVKDDSFTVSFVTDESTTAFIKYGTEANSLKLQAGDDRDQLSGSVNPSTTHYITVRDLQPSKAYYYTLGTGSSSKFDNNGAPFTVQTTKKIGTPPLSKTIYGNISSENGTPASGAIVYIKVGDAGELSALVKESGSWALPLSNARNGDSFAAITDTDQLNISVQGPLVSSTAVVTALVSEAQPVKNITLGQNGGAETSTTETTTVLTSPSPNITLYQTPSPSPDIAIQNPLTTTGTGSTGNLGSLLETAPSASPTATVVDVSTPSAQIVDTTQPTITGVAAPNVTIMVEVHSEEQITTQKTTGSDGSYTIDLNELGKQLEPGEHTVTVTYTDPKTNKLVTTTKTFTVSPAATSTLLAQASTSPQPFGTSNPYTIVSPTPEVSTDPTATDSTIPRISRVASGSDLPRSGSVSTTYLLIFVGCFFIMAGGWSYIQSRKMQEVL